MTLTTDLLNEVDRVKFWDAPCIQQTSGDSYVFALSQPQGVTVDKAVETESTYRRVDGVNYLTGQEIGSYEESITFTYASGNMTPDLLSLLDGYLYTERSISTDYTALIETTSASIPARTANQDGYGILEDPTNAKLYKLNRDASGITEELTQVTGAATPNAGEFKMGENAAITLNVADVDTTNGSIFRVVVPLPATTLVARSNTLIGNVKCVINAVTTQNRIIQFSIANGQLPLDSSLVPDGDKSFTVQALSSDLCGSALQVTFKPLSQLYSPACAQT